MSARKYAIGSVQRIVLCRTEGNPAQKAARLKASDSKESASKICHCFCAVPFCAKSLHRMQAIDYKAVFLLCNCAPLKGEKNAAQNGNSLPLLEVKGRRINRPSSGAKGVRA